MSNAVPIRIADAVASEINSAVTAESFSTLGFIAERRYFDWDFDYKDLKDMAVEVVFRTTQPEGSVALHTHGHLKYETAVDIVIRKRFEPYDKDADGRLKNTAVDPLVTLLQEIHEHFAAGRNTVPLDDETEAKWIGSDVMSWVQQGKLRKGLFEGVVRVHFSMRKAI